MSAQLFDVRLVRSRAGVWRLSVDGRPLPSVSGETPSAALHALAVALTAVAWCTGEHEADELADPASRLYGPPADAGYPVPSVSAPVEPDTAPADGPRFVPCLYASVRP